MARIKITKQGYLEIRGKLRQCRPPGDSPCGDWCALFGEPRKLGKDQIFLNLCHQFWTCSKEDFTDERKVKDHAKNR